MESRPPYATQGPEDDFTMADLAKSESGDASSIPIPSEEDATESVFGSDMDLSPRPTRSTIFPDDSISQRNLQPRARPAKWEPSQSIQSVSEGGDEPVYSFHSSADGHLVGAGSDTITASSLRGSIL
ncbi:hypothetical protein FRB93_013775 [Tulasnella sp. JGI-2019a]|nr:hypothetical protein FRB93_013775 [Tulasnella sp. JGI-2019a]